MVSGEILQHTTKYYYKLLDLTAIQEDKAFTFPSLALELRPIKNDKKRIVEDDIINNKRF